MPVVHVTLHLPDDLWHAVHALSPHDGDANTVIRRALEEYVTAAAKPHGTRSGRRRDLVQALSMPVAERWDQVVEGNPGQARNAGVDVGYESGGRYGRAAVVAAVPANLHATTG